MHALIPLLFIFILFNNKQIKEDKLYRANIFALVGISYFGVLQYTIYWYRIFPSEGLVQYLPGLLAVLFTVAIALSPWNRRSHPLKTLVLCGFFVLSLVASYGFDKVIKESLAEIGGFFQRDVMLKSDRVADPNGKSIELPNVGLRLLVPRNWQQRQLPSGHYYFTNDLAQTPLLEVRPNCLDELLIDTPTYISNLLQLFEANGPDTEYETRCAMLGKTKNCLVKVKYPPSSAIKGKWQWLEIPDDSSRAFSVDFLLFDESPDLEKEVVNVIANVQLLETLSTEPCRTPAAWL